MNVEVGTMYCGEGDFEECKKSIMSQDCPVDHVVIENTEEALAHYQLYSGFKERGADILVKVDADMVLKHSDVISKFIKQISMGYTRVTYLVDDFFTGQTIQGINAYSSRISVPDKKHFMTKIKRTPDRFMGKNKTTRIDKSVAWHCYHANEKQAFHFGFHRYLKKSNDKCKMLYHRWKSEDHPLLRMACLGMNVAFQNASMDEAYCYGDAFDSIFNNHKSEASDLIYRDLRKIIRRIR